MPRMQTPQGYYTASEVKRLLNVSDAVVRSYAQKGRIKYVVPPNRKQGFYLKKDVDSLVVELTAFLNFGENIEETDFLLATHADLMAMLEIGYALFLPDRTPFDKNQIMAANKAYSGRTTYHLTSINQVHMQAIQAYNGRLRKNQGIAGRLYKF